MESAVTTLVKALAKSSLLNKDFDYHLLRASMVIIFLFFGYQKWFAYEAQVLIPYISNGRSYPGCTQFSAFGEPAGSWEFRSNLTRLRR
jgi:hypothetical protein